ncbi:MAG: ribbon-helix-helix domain-containing protein [Nanoarchaeota archaeon]
MDTVCLKMEDTLLESIDRSLKAHRYSTRTEFIRDAIRCRLTELEKEDAIRRLTELKGSLRPRRSEQEAGEIAIDRIAKKLKIRLD